MCLGREICINLRVVGDGKTYIGPTTIYVLGQTPITRGEFSSTCFEPFVNK